MRSGTVRPRVNPDSNAMVFCRGIWADGDGLLRNLVGSDILLFLGDGEITTRASPKSAHLEQPMKVLQAVCRDSWRPDRPHCRADPGIEHPCRKCCDDARFNLNVEDGSAGPLLAIMGSDTVAVKRMPRIVNYNFSPDMGRMTA